jgi:hypothetical protein
LQKSLIEIYEARPYASASVIVYKPLLVFVSDGCLSMSGIGVRNWGQGLISDLIASTCLAKSPSSAFFPGDPCPPAHR